MMNDKLSRSKDFGHVTHQDDSNDAANNSYLSFRSASFYCGLRLVLVYPDPHLRKADLKLLYTFCGGTVEIVLMSLFYLEGQNFF